MTKEKSSDENKNSRDIENIDEVKIIYFDEEVNKNHIITVIRPRSQSFCEEKEQVDIANFTNEFGPVKFPRLSPIIEEDEKDETDVLSDSNISYSLPPLDSGYYNE